METMIPRPKMADGGKWMQAPHDVPPVYLGPKQYEAHFKRLVSDGWMPIPDPRPEMMEVKAPTPVNSVEVALKAQVDQLQAMVIQLMAQVTQSVAKNTVAEEAQKPQQKGK